MPRLRTTPDAVRLLQEGYLALSEVEHNGVRVDKEYVDQTTEKVAGMIKDGEAKLRSDPLYSRWRRRFGEKANIGSYDQLADLVFGELGYTSVKKTESGDREAASEASFAKVDVPFVHDWFKVQKLKKIHGTYLVGLRREMVRHADGDWYVHPSYNGNRVVTHRSSCVAKGTMIEVVRDVSRFPSGIPIEQVNKGDFVYCYDDELKLTVRRVLWAGKTGTKRVVRIHWSASSRKKGYLDVTSDHRIRLSDGQYVPAGELLGRPNTRPSGKSHRAPRCSVLAMGRRGDLLHQTGDPDPILDHRLVYSSLVGPLLDQEVVHHKDQNHLNNTVLNLEKLPGQSEHASIHAPTVLTDEVRRKGIAARQENHKLYGDRWPSGEDSYQWIALTKFRVLRILAEHGGSPTEVRNRGLMDFDTFKKKMKMVGVDQSSVRRRYDATGKYITRGRMIRAAGRGLGPACKELAIGYYNAKSLYSERSIDVGTGLGRGVIVNNHAVTRVEDLGIEVDVYDLTVDEHSNYIANEICVHNCDSPNFQNNPVRNPMAGEIVRRSYIARRGQQLGELDYGQIEVRVPCFYNFDPSLMNYVTDPSTDMHRDMAVQLFKLEPKQVSKECRHIAKNEFVFPTFYGSYYGQCAPAMWESLERRSIKVEGTDTLVRDHLDANGIKSLGACKPGEDPVKGTFEYHVKEIEEDFWGRRFQVYSEWKKKWWEDYLRNGGFQMLTGFAVNLPLDRKQVCNSPIQGVAFHLTLWSLTRIVEWLRKYKMRSMVIGEVHDCINLDLYPSERDDVIYKCRKIMTETIRKWAPWINVPLVVEPEICPIDGSWFEKMAMVEKGGSWVPGSIEKWEKTYGAWVA